MPKIGNRLVRWWVTFCGFIVVAVTLGALFIGAWYGLGRLIRESGLDETFTWGTFAGGLYTLLLIILGFTVLGFIVGGIDQLGNMLFDSAAATAEKKAIPW